MGNSASRTCSRKFAEDADTSVVNSRLIHSDSWWDGSHVQKSWHFVRQQRSNQSTKAGTSEEHLYESVSERSTTEEVATQTSLCGLLDDYSVSEIDHIYSQIRKRTARNHDNSGHYETLPVTVCQPSRFDHHHHPNENDEFDQFYTEYNNYVSGARLTNISKDISTILTAIELERMQLDRVVEDVRQLRQRLNNLESTKSDLVELLQKQELLGFDRLCCSCQGI